MTDYPAENQRDLGGRPPHEPTDASRRQVEAMAGYGIPQEQIALSLDITENTLRKYYRRELDLGVVKANAKVAETLFNQATREGNTTAAIWWSKSRMGWREPKQEVEHSGTVNLSLAERLDAAVRKAITDYDRS